MDLLTHFRRMFAYDDWANREVIAMLRRAGTPPPRALKFLAHILAAERLWLGRLRQDGVAVEVWPERTLDQCAAEVDALSGLWRAYLDGLAPDSLAATIAYTNTQGEPWTSAVGDILTHVANHSTYHRGQIATELGAVGLSPSNTDFIHAVRRGLVE